MYEAVRATEASTASRLAATAASAGYDGVVLRNAWSSGGEPSPERIREDVGVDVVRAAEVVAETPQQARGHVGNRRPDVDLLLVRGGTVALNRFAVEASEVDVLARPMHDEGDVNHVLLRAAADNDVHVEVNLGPVLRTDGGPRVRALKSLRKLVELLDAYDAPHVVSADPDGHLALRAPRELAALGEALGADAAFVREGLRAWGQLAERRRRERSAEWVAPGVRVAGPDDPDEGSGAGGIGEGVDGREGEDR